MKTEKKYEKAPFFYQIADHNLKHFLKAIKGFNYEIINKGEINQIVMRETDIAKLNAAAKKWEDTLCSLEFKQRSKRRKEIFRGYESKKNHANNHVLRAAAILESGEPVFFKTMLSNFR